MRPLKGRIGVRYHIFLPVPKRVWGWSLTHFMPKTGEPHPPHFVGRSPPKFNSILFSVKRRQRHRQRGDPPTGPQRGRRLRDGERALPDRLGQRGAEEAGGMDGLGILSLIKPSSLTLILIKEP